MQIEAKDLRLGNIVQDEHGIILYVFRLWNGGAELSEEKDGSGDLDYSNEDIFGIPLTEEWLLKFEEISFIWGDYGFMDDMIRYVIDINHKKYQSTDIVIIADYDRVTLAIAQIQYVHQLQNLYFALTNKELELCQKKKH